MHAVRYARERIKVEDSINKTYTDIVDAIRYRDVIARFDGKKPNANSVNMEKLKKFVNVNAN